jgi:hypothetical protein
MAGKTHTQPRPNIYPKAPPAPIKTPSPQSCRSFRGPDTDGAVSRGGRAPFFTWRGAPKIALSTISPPDFR